ncbi:MAG: phage baseplate assembly protein [Xanthomonadaceae bacterium]|nr:phage baseplate assembly protein [Xanthomonadaceae bacterium]
MNIGAAVQWLGQHAVGALRRGRVAGALRGPRPIVTIAMSSGETKTMELLLPYGMSALPAQGDVLVAAIGGQKDHFVALGADDITKRIGDLAAGEFGFYDGNSAVVWRGGGLEIWSTLPVTVQSDGQVNVTGAGIGIGAIGDSLQKLVDARFVALFNAHVHGGVQAGGSNTGTPTVAMAVGSHTTTHLVAG